MKKRIMIDMDDVIVDTGSCFMKQIEDFIGEKVDITKTGYYLQNALGDRKEEFFKKGPIDMYKDTPLNDGAYDVIKKLNDFYEVFIVTSYNIPDAPYQEGNHLKRKMDYLQEKLPFIKTEQILFINNKQLIDFDIRIDDSIRHLTHGEILLLFDAYNNQELTKEELDAKNIRRVMNFKEIADILLKEEVYGKITESNCE